MGTARSELVAVRFDPETKFLLELGSRAQRRSTANFVEEAVLDAVARLRVQMPQGDMALLEIGKQLWDVHPLDRLINMWLKHPSLLSYDEQTFLKFVREIFPVALGREFVGSSEDRVDLRSYKPLFDGAMAQDFEPSVLGKLIAEQEANEHARARNVDLKALRYDPNNVSVAVLVRGSAEKAAAKRRRRKEDE